MGTHIFDYIDRMSAKSPIFFNFIYAVDTFDTVLRPRHRTSDLVNKKFEVF